MTETSLHSALEMRLLTLGARIDALKQKMSNAPTQEKVREFAELAELERRHKTLDERVRKLNQEGPGFRQNIKAELVLMADDLMGMSEDLMVWIDTGSQPDPSGKRRQ
ncbi:MAG: hypothetical protein P4L90_26620 [Rhodopila sp.]|nr:hypothetical protein [Rhodopila sp.]